MAPPDGFYYIQTPAGNNVVRSDKLGDKLFIAAPKPNEWNQIWYISGGVISAVIVINSGTLIVRVLLGHAAMEAGSVVLAADSFKWDITDVIGSFIGKIGNDTEFWNLNENEVALDGEGLVFNFVRYVLPDGLVTGPGRPDGLVYNLVPVAESRDDADVAR